MDFGGAVGVIRDLVARLEREMYAESEGTTAERAYRKGWNDRARSLIRELSIEAGLEEMVEHVSRVPEPVHERFDLGGES